MTRTAIQNSQDTALVSLEELCACPRCQASVSLQKERLHCKKCKATFRNIGGIPWLFEHGDRTYWDWKARVDRFLNGMELERQQIRSELSNPNLLELTRKRLLLQETARIHNEEAYKKLFSSFFELKVPPIPWQSVPQTKIPHGTVLGSYAPNLFRDWCWGNEENEKSVQLVSQVLKDISGMRLLVLGAGSCRLAYDLSEKLAPSITVAVDYHPLHLLAAKSVMEGKTLSLFEFPLSPISIDHSAVLRNLKCPGTQPQNFHFVFADATHPPFLPGAFDVILTPWFIDVVPERLDPLVKRINRLLKPNGKWIHFGPLGFQSKTFSRNYSREEVEQITTNCGFKITGKKSECIPYLKSSESLHFRNETVQLMAAEKVTNQVAETTTYLPSWLTSLQEPVPRLPEFTNALNSSQVTLTMSSLIDGKRSINDLVKILAAQTKGSEDLVCAAVVGVLTYLFETGNN